MPPLPVIANTYRTVLDWGSVGGTNPRNVMHFRDTLGTQTASDLFHVADDGATSDMWGYLTDSSVCGLLHITPLDGVTGTSEFATTAPGWTGPQTGQYMPQVAQVIKLVTGLRGRSNRGRVFLGPVAESVAANGILIAGDELAAQHAAWVSFETTLHAAGWEIVVASYKLGTAQSVTAISNEQILATQRRRQSRLR